jgi:hypothetical protein
MFMSGRVSENNGLGTAGRSMICVAAFSLGYAWGLDGLGLGSGQFVLSVPTLALWGLKVGTDPAWMFLCGRVSEENGLGRLDVLWLVLPLFRWAMLGAWMA